jgi:hypothetical protein
MQYISSIFVVVDGAAAQLAWKSCGELAIAVVSVT